MNRTHGSLSAVALLSVATFAAPPSESPFSQPQPAFYGQVRPRLEFNHKSFADTAHTSAYTLLRSRIGFNAVTSEFSEVKLELQDSRVLGGTPATGLNGPSTTTGNSKGVDLSQGYAALQFLFGEENPYDLKVAAGRMKMSLGAGRFLSTLEWSPTARQLDGIAANVRKGDYNVSGFAFMIRDTTTPVKPIMDQYHALYGGYASGPALDTMLQIDLGAFYDVSRFRNVAPANPDTTLNYDLVYLDGRVYGKVGFFTYEQEFIWQGGEAWVPKLKKNASSNAFYSSSRIGVSLPMAKVNLGSDVMSGDNKADDELTQYRASYYFGHAYFGWMDYFVNNPRYGVIDARADVDVPVGEFGSIKAQYHYFMPQVDKDVAGKSLDPYGHEINAEFHVTRIPKTLIVLGAGVFVPGDGAYLLGNGLGKATDKTAPSTFFYVMPTFNF